MEKKIIIGSVTYAMRARDLLNKNGIKARIERKASEYKNGCGYAVVFDSDTKEAEELLKSNGIKILNIL